MRARRSRESGASTVEFAASLPLLAAFTIALCGGVLLARDAVLAQGAAREGARAAAVGGDLSLAAPAARAALPAGRKATVVAGRSGPDRIRVEVGLRLPLPYAHHVPITASAVAAVEPAKSPSPPRAPSSVMPQPSTPGSDP